MVDVTRQKAFKKTVTLKELKAKPELSNMKVLQKGQRLSVMPVTREEFDIVSAMGMKEER